MRVQVVEATVMLYPYFDKGIVDRRFRTGYRVMPAAKVNVQLQLTLSNQDGIWRLREHIRIIGYGDYMVTINDIVRGTIEIMSLKAKNDQPYVTLPSFKVPNFVECLSLGFTAVGEGSCG